MTGLETGEKLQKALKTEGEQVTLVKKPLSSGFRFHLHFPVARGQFQAGKRWRVLSGPVELPFAALHRILPGKKQILQFW